MSRPTSGELEKLTDPAEVEYVNAKRGTVPDDQLLDDIRQYRAINAANRRAESEDARPMEAAYASNSTAESEAVPIETTTDEPATEKVAAPTLEEFLAKAQPLNPDAPASALVQYWERTYGERGPADLPTLDDFLSEAQPKNPDRSVDELTAYWKDQYGSRGAMEHAPGVGETIWEGAKAAGRSLAAFGMTLHGDTEGVGEIAKEETVRNPALLRFMRELDKKKQQLGPDASWWDVGKALGSTAIEEPAGAGYLFAEQLPNTGVALGSAAAGAAIGSTLGPLGTIVGGLAGLFVANVGLETGGKALEKATDGMTDVERAEALREGVTKGSIISAVDTATFGATKWLTGTTARAMEAATIRVLLDEGIDIADRTAVQAATKNKLIAQRVQDAQAKAVEGVNTIAKRAARGGTEAGLETLGEGVGEYVGELAATGKGDKMEALVEAFSGFGQSAAEIGIAAGLSRREAFELRRQGENATAEVPPKTQTEIIREVGRTTDQVNAGIVKEIFGGATVDDAVKKAQDIVDQPPIGITQLDDFIAKEKGEGEIRYTDAQRAVDQAAYERVIEKARGAERDPTTGKWTFRGGQIEVVNPETLPESDAPLTKSHFEAISVALQAQGKRLVVVQEGTGFDGIVNRVREPDVVFITNKPSVDPTVVAFHEAGHLMQGTPLYKAFQELVVENLRPGSKKLAIARHGQGLSDLGLLNEISADIAGDAMTDPAFMEKVFLRMQEQVGEQQAHEEAQTFLDKIKEIITNVRKAITGRTFTTRDGRRLANLYVKNLEKIHEALSRAIADVYLRAGKPLTSTQKSQAEEITESRREGEERVILPTDVTTAFHEIGAIQRDRPERAMIKVQELAGGGVLNPVVEHIGDLTHRMTHMAGYGTALQPYVQEKVDRGLKYLTHAYGFEKEMLENLAANAAYNKMGKAELTLKVKEALAAYAAEHEKIPVYNLPQWLAKQAAIAVGRRKWDRAVAFLKELKKIADSKDFTTSAFAYARDKEGKLKPYKRPVHAALIALTPEGKLRISEDAERQQYHLTEDVGDLRAGTKISKAELAQRGYEVAPSDLISHEEDRSRRALAEEGISESSSKKPTSDIGHKRQASGKYVGAPKEIVNPQKLISLRERLLRLAKEGEPGRLWYEESGKAILDLAEGNVSLAEKIVGLFAIYSPMSLVSGNTTIALKAYYQWANGEPITAINTQGKISAEKAQRWMDGTMNAHDVTGIKRNNFYKNLMRVINPEELGAEAQGVTVDMWIARALGYHQTVVGEAQYFFAEREIKRLANLLKWEPQQAQAAVWVSIKSRIEEVYDEVRNIATEKGWLIRGGYTNAAGKFIGEWKPKDANGRTHFERLLLAKALKIRTIDVEEASYNFADAIRERLAQISWEATPGKSTGVLPGIHLADYGKQAEYLDAIDTVLRDENGQDKIAVMVKLAGANTMLGPGGWQGNIGISGQTRTAVATDKNKVTEPARKLINLYSDIRGYILTQEGIYWHYPIYQEAKKRANGIEIDFGRPLSVEEMKALYDAIITWAGHDEWAPAYTERGVRILNFKDENHLGFHETIKGVLETFPLDSTWKTFGVDGDARMNNWKESPHGEEYVQRIREAGRSDLLGAVEDLRKAVLAVNRDFSERYGWGTATLPGDETIFSRSIELDHYSNARNLSTIHPKFHGTGQIGEERRRMESAEPGTYLPRSYFYRAGTKPEPRFKGMQKYRVEVPVEKIVDLATVEGKDATEREQNAKRAGYIGYYNSKSAMPNVVALFTPVKVATDETELSRADEIDNAAVSLDDEQPLLSPAPMFYSQLESVLEAKMPNKASTQQVLGILTNSGVKQEEIEWIGVKEFLADKTTVTKQDLLTFVRANQIEIREVVKGQFTPEKQERIRQYLEGEREITDLRDRGGRISAYTAMQRLNALRIDLGLSERDLLYHADETKFKQYTLPGVKNYQEILLTIPPKNEGLPPGFSIYQKTGLWYVKFPDGSVVGNWTTREAAIRSQQNQPASAWTPMRTVYQLRDAEGIAYAQGDEQSAARWRAEGKTVHETQVPDLRKGSTKEFVSGHFNELNILAHVRTSDRTGPNGEKILFLEEVQSDWHQKGRTHGYAGTTVDKQLEDLKQEYVNLNKILGSPTPDPEGARAAYQRQLDITDEINSLQDLKQYGVPDAPFKKTWHEFALKRMLRYAAENGYTHLGWTTGEQQAERYNLSKHLSKVIATRSAIDRPGSPPKVRIVAYDPSGHQIISKYYFENGLDEAVGKELAEKILAQPKGDDHTYSGLDLKVGGEGMKGFYDQILPAFMNKYGKKWGAKTTTTEIDNFAKSGEPRYLYDEDGVRHTNPKYFTRITVHAVPITESMTQAIVFEEGQPMFSTAEQSTARVPNYQIDQPGKLDRLIRILQDKTIDIKRIVESIRREGGSIPDELNPILKEEMYQKRAEQRTTDFTNDELRPLIEIMRVNKVDLQELDQYAHARHVITDKLNARLKALNPNMPNNDALSGLTDAEAQRIFASSSPERKQLLETLMQRVDRMVERTRDLMVDYGLEKESTIATWRKTYKSYVPLRREGFDEEGNPTGTGRSVRGSTAHPRVGSTLAVENVLANIAQARDQVITRGEKMRPVIAFAGLMMLHPNKSLASLDKPASIEMTDPTTGLLVTVPGDLADYKVPRVRRFNPATGRVESYPDPTYKGRDNVVNFRIAGVDYAIVFNERNERAMEVAKAFKELDSGKLTGVMKAVAPYTRYLASINTQYNPIFGIVNFVRDAQFAMLGLTSTPLAGMQGTVLKNAVSSLAGIYQDARDARYGLHPTSATAQMWERFQHVGGPTGYRDLFFTASDRAAEIERMLNPNTWANLRTPQKLARRLEDSAMFKLLSDYNLTMENAIRLGVFKTAVDRGLSDLQAASLAKNITVNFNKRGQVGAQMGSLYAFFNANVQGTARILETLFERTPEGGFRISSAGKKIIAGGLLLGVLQTFMLAIAGFDDDEPPEYIKNRNLVIPVPGTEKGYVMLPMPLGFNLLPNAGRLAAEVVRSAVSGRPAHVTEKGFSLLEAMFNSLSPTGGTGGLVTELSPTVTDPFMALATNKDWTGKAISKEDISSLKPTPGHTRARDTATVWAMTLSRAINWATGGTDYTPGVLSPTPDAIDFMIQQATGGVGREVSKAAQVVKSAATGEELPFYKVPLLGRFAGSASGSSSVRDKFYDNIRAVNLAVEEIKGRALHQEEFQSFLRQNPEARFEKTANSIQRTIHDLQRQKHDMVKKGASRDAVRMKEEQILGLMRRFNTVLDENRKLR